MCLVVLCHCMVCRMVMVIVREHLLAQRGEPLPWESWYCQIHTGYAVSVVPEK